jgi:hypothetical protein
MKDGKVYIIVGHYGSGKTEFSVNFVYKLINQGRKVAISDLDIVNPYFRSRERSEEFKKAGVKLISNNFENDNLIDMPALSAEVQSLFVNKERDNIIDVGGDAVGATVLGRFAKDILKIDYEMWIVVNANRYQTQTVEQVLEYMRGIEFNSKLKINGLINNTHYLRETSIEDVIRGDKLVREISKNTGVPVKYVAYLKEIHREVEKLNLLGKSFPIDLYMRPNWL